MDSSVGGTARTIRAVTEFSIEPAANPSRAANRLICRGRPVTRLVARVIEGQYRLADGKTLLLASDDEPFEETLTILLLSAELRVLGREILGGATTPGFMAYVEPFGENEVAFCWHDHELVVRVERHRPWWRLRPRWLKLRDLVPQLALGWRVRRPTP